MNNRTTTAPNAIEPTLQARWSPRAFNKTHELSEHHLLAAFEAARWSPSASNTQPWRFIVGYRGDDQHEKILGALVEGNRSWAHRAAALIVNLTETHDESGNARRWAEYDLGQAVAHFSVQAHADGLHVHQVGGFDTDAIREAFSLPERLRPVTVTVVGQVGEPEVLTDSQRERELAPRTRLELSNLLF